MADKVHEQTDEKLAGMERHLSAIYSRAEKEIGKAWKDYLTESNSEIKRLQKLYDEAEKSGNKSEMKRIRIELSKAKRDATLKDNHYRRMTDQLALDITHVNEKSAAYVNGELPEIYTANYNSVAPQTENISGYSFSLVDEQTVRNLATKDETLLPYKYIDRRKDLDWNTKKINAEVLQGILQGEPMDKIANRFSKVLGMNETAAIRNARTTVTAAECKGRQDSFVRLTDDGVIMKREWIATNDNRTRHWHAELDGKKADVDKPFSNAVGLIMYPADPHADPANVYNCRCTIVSDIIGFKPINSRENVENVENSPAKILESLSEPKRPRKADFEDLKEFYREKEKYKNDLENFQKTVSEIAKKQVPSHAMTDAELNAWMKKNDVIIYGSLEGLDRRVLTAWTAEAEKMFDEFPIVKKMENAKGLKHEISFSPKATYFAEATHGMHFGSPFKNMQTAVEEYLGQMISTEDGKRFNVLADGTISSLFHHEFGHNVKDAIYYSIENAYDRIEFEHDIVSMLFNKNGISKYAETNKDELFAEGFAAWYGKENSDFAKGFDELIRKWMK